MYCGNNALHPEVISGRKIIGTRYKCMQKGINVGLNQPLDLNYNVPFEPIDNRKFYCGNNNILPDGYHDNGTLYHCFTKGIGIGKVQANEQNNENNENNEKEPVVKTKFSLIIFVFLYLTICAIFIITLYYTKPSFITITNNGVIEIDWTKFGLYIALFCIIIAILFYIIKRMYLTL